MLGFQQNASAGRQKSPWCRRRSLVAAFPQWRDGPAPQRHSTAVPATSSWRRAAPASVLRNFVTRWRTQMPFINGRFYMNPAYGRAVEQARTAAATSHPHQPQDPNAHWVTMDGRHVLIREAQPGRASIHEVSQKNRGRRAAIADAARKHDGDTSMPYTPGHPTCNLFVQKAVAESGAPKPVVRKADGTIGAPSAAEWANSPVPGWRFLEPGEIPQPGDVAARKENFADATGHSGIVVSVSKDGVVTAMAAHQSAIGKDMSFQPGSQKSPNNNVYRRYTGD